MQLFRESLVKPSVLRTDEERKDNNGKQSHEAILATVQREVMKEFDARGVRLVDHRIKTFGEPHMEQVERDGEQQTQWDSLHRRSEFEHNNAAQKFRAPGPTAKRIHNLKKCAQHRNQKHALY